MRYNSVMDYRAKCELWKFDLEYPPDQQHFPFEPICMFVREEKMTSDMASHIQLPSEYKVLDLEQFKTVGWDNVPRSPLNVSSLGL